MHPDGFWIALWTQFAAAIGTADAARRGVLFAAQFSKPTANRAARNTCRRGESASKRVRIVSLSIIQTS
jgi:hypothetical protein